MARGWSVLRALGGQCYPAPGTELFASREAAREYVRAQQEGWQDKAATRPAIYLLCEAIQGEVGAEEEPGAPEEFVQVIMAEIQAEVIALKNNLERHVCAVEVDAKDLRKLWEELASVKTPPPSGDLDTLWEGQRDLNERASSLKQEVNFLRAEIQELANRVRAIAPPKPANGRRKENKIG